MSYLTGHGCTICGSDSCLGDVDLSLVAGGVPVGRSPRKALAQAADIQASLDAAAA